jgi:hypothetical protein
VLLGLDPTHYVFCGPEILGGNHILRVAYMPSGDLDGAALPFVVPGAFQIRIERSLTGTCVAQVAAGGASVPVAPIAEPVAYVALATTAARASYDWIFVTSVGP